MNEKLCLLCQAGPVDECNETGVPVTVRAPPAQRLEGRTSEMLRHMGHEVPDV